MGPADVRSTREVPALSEDTSPPASPGRDDGSAAPSTRVVPKWRAWLWVFLAGLTGVLTGTATFLVTGYVTLTNNVKHEVVTQKDLGPRPVKVVNSAVNVLLVGSDARDGANARYGKFGGERTDTIILAHISPKRDGALLISFPRDSLVDLPNCPARRGFPGQNRHVGMINESFNAGGVSCTWKTIEGLTGIHIDHFVKVDFTGFKEMVNALGGVPVCVPEPGILDRKALLKLSAGRHLLTGEQSLGYVRARYSLGDGSDIGRIQRQQMFLASMAKKAMSGETLTDPAQLFDFLDAVTRSITTDPELSVGVMKDLAMSAKGITAGQIRFVTAPWRYSLTNPGRVEWVQPQADNLFKMVASDEVSTSIKTGEQKIPKSQIHIIIQNGSGRPSLATTVAADLEQRGYHIAKIQQAPKYYPKTVLKYTPAGESRAPRLFRELKQTTTFRVASGTTPRLLLIVGADWEGLKPPKTLDDIDSFDATHDTC
ncbi:LCP family protein [Acrocarpospora catenulata]|uniref:LCP family protein n=1 Tax=Acrocarpospora catenulata TaxID=2836182 RepID=UPI0027E121A1|nr:LCP family protein [Acrocarpospora catenulata]